jgi:AcrR family transcriptional regulator
MLSGGIVAHIAMEAPTAAPASARPDPPSRRDRVRGATVAEIKSLAWAQIAENGAAALSLRAIAREMGMTSSALYRYFTSREQLLSALAQDGFASLADHLEAAETQLDEGGANRFLRVVRAYRSWALDHRTEYALTFGSPVPGLECHVPEVKAEMERGVAVLLRVMIEGLRAGLIQPPPLVGAHEPALRAKLARWAGTIEEELSAESLGACMFAWSQLHGAISVELFGHMPPDLMPADELFEYQMHEVLRTIGCQLSDQSPVDAGPDSAG